jgi:hypothetical protein
MARAASGYHKVLAENRVLYNEVQDLKGGPLVIASAFKHLRAELN